MVTQVHGIYFLDDAIINKISATRHPFTYILSKCKMMRIYQSNMLLNELDSFLLTLWFDFLFCLTELLITSKHFFLKMSQIWPRFSLNNVLIIYNMSLFQWT